MRALLILVFGGVLATVVFITGDRKRMKSVMKWAKKRDILQKFVSWIVFKKILRQLRQATK